QRQPRPVASLLPYTALFRANDGNGGADYTVTTHDASGTITARALDINAVTETKPYDGTTSSSKTPTTGTLYSTDTVTASQSFGSRHVLGLGASVLHVNAGYLVNDGNGGADYTVRNHTARRTSEPLRRYTIACMKRNID